MAPIADKMIKNPKKEKECNEAFITCSIAQLSVRLIRPLNALLNHLPELIYVHSSGYPYTCFASRQHIGNRPAGLLLAALCLLSCALGNDGHVKAFIVLSALTFNTIPVVKENFVRSAGEDGREGKRIVEGGTGGDAKDIAIWFVSW